MKSQSWNFGKAIRPVFADPVTLLLFSKTCLPKPMCDISATISKNSLIIAGYEGADGKRYNGVFITTMDDIIDHSSSTEGTSKWRKLASTPYWNTTIVPCATPAVIVGWSIQGSTFDDIMAYDDSTNSWRRVSSLPIKCCYTTILSLPHNIIMAGGYTDSKTVNTAYATSSTMWITDVLIIKQV